MKILHINTNDLSGGAAIAAMRLHKAMLKDGLDSTFLCLRRTVNDDERILKLPRLTSFVAIINHKVRTKFLHHLTLSRKKGLFSDLAIGLDVTRFIDVSSYDVIYIHWINGGFLNYKALKKLLSSGKPIYWFMHDMFPITGGCHYSFGCEGYTQKCGSCPYIRKASIKDASYKQYKKKQKLLTKYKNLSFISPSAWLYDCASRGSLTEGHKVIRIPNLIDSNVYKKMDKSLCRYALDIPLDSKIILFGADGALTNPYKGFEYLEEALNIISKDSSIDTSNIMLLVFGSSYNKAIEERLPFKARFMGYLHDNYSLNLLYNSADVFCIPSTAEAFGQTALESICCNTPVVGFNVGGIPDLVTEDTGYLARYKDASDLAYGIKSILQGSIKPSFKTVSQWSEEEVLKAHKALLGLEEKVLESHF